MSRWRSLLFPLAAIVLLSVSHPCWAVSLPPVDIADWKLKYSNVFTAGGPWGDVQVAANNTGASASFTDNHGVTHTLQNGEALLIYTAYTTPYTSLGANFGFDKIGFNSFADLSSSSVNVTVTGAAYGSKPPVTWELTNSSGSLSEFGKYQYDDKSLTGTGSRPEVIADITGLGNAATIQNFEVFPQNSSFQPPQYVAGHIISFNLDGQTSQWVAGAPEPSSWILLAGTALASLGYNYWLSSRRLRLSLGKAH